MASIGGLSNLAIFRLSHSTGAAPAVKQIDGTTAATLLTHASLHINGSGNDGIVQTGLNPQEDGSLQITWTQTKDDGTLDDFLDTFCPQGTTASSSVGELKFENAKKIGGASGGGGVSALIIAAGAEDDNGKVKTYIAVGTFKKTSGSQTWQAETYNQPTLEFVSQELLGTGNLSVIEALFDSTIWKTGVGGIGAQTLAVGKHYKRLRLDPAA